MFSSSQTRTQRFSMDQTFSHDSPHLPDSTTTHHETTAPRSRLPRFTSIVAPFLESLCWARRGFMRLRSPPKASSALADGVRIGQVHSQQPTTMNLRLATLLFAFPGAVLASDIERTPAPRPRLTEALRNRVAEMSTAHKGPSLVQDRSAATDTISQNAVVGGDHGMIGRPNGPSPASRPFNLRDGGTYWSRNGPRLTTELTLQFDAPNAGWDLLKISF
jgi:hypothetical protein